MATPFVGQIIVVPYNFAPYGWATCNGQVLPISQYTALFSLLGTYYGGNGTSNFALPNLQDSVPVGAGSSNFGTFDLGETGGSLTITLTETQLPSHNHVYPVSTAAATTSNPTKGTFAVPNVNPRMHDLYAGTNNAQGALTTDTGGGQAHDNVQPSLGMMYIIALQGVFPARS